MASGDDARPLGGFHSYADDTPRDDLADETPIAAGWSDTPAWRSPEASPEPRLWRSPLVASCAVIALIAAGVGWATMRPPVPRPASPTPAVEAAARAPLQVVVAEPPPPAPLAPAAERLDVLPSQQMDAAVAAPPAQLVIPRPAPARATAPLPPALPRETPSAVETGQAAAVRTLPEPRRFDACADAPTPACEMVCSDRWLAEADRRMKRAYSAALAAGVPPDALRRDQEDWLDVREDAAQISRRAVADIYRQRTRELFALAERR
jgi:uncharacterized protein YecT (DUF1311 family)